MFYILPVNFLFFILCIQMPIYMVHSSFLSSEDLATKVTQKTLGELLPMSFGPGDLERQTWRSAILSSFLFRFVCFCLLSPSLSASNLLIQLLCYLCCLVSNLVLWEELISNQCQPIDWCSIVLGIRNIIKSNVRLDVLPFY